ncbi:class I lanthipeptide [Ferruginibacter sp. SUN106]|uniref:class I lanthipeptide n=1 Tax=Ferruginibacter sp. SUN106 TaxID=2978348 RepID=UPI003D3603CA
MKQDQSKGKLQLKKQAISNLSLHEMKTIKGGAGDGDATTSSQILCFTWCLTHTIYDCATLFTCTISVN